MHANLSSNCTDAWKGMESIWPKTFITCLMWQPAFVCLLTKSQKAMRFLLNFQEMLIMEYFQSATDHYILETFQILEGFWPLIVQRSKGTLSYDLKQKAGLEVKNKQTVNLSKPQTEQGDQWKSEAETSTGGAEMAALACLYQESADENILQRWFSLTCAIAANLSVLLTASLSNRRHNFLLSTNDYFGLTS